MVTKEQVYEWLRESYLGNLDGDVPREVIDLVGKAFMLGTEVAVSKDLEKSYVQLWEALARGFVAGIKMGQVPDRSSLEDLEEMMRNNPGGLKRDV